MQSFLPHTFSKPRALLRLLTKYSPQLLVLVAGLFMLGKLTACHAITESEIKKNKEASALYWQANKDWRNGNSDAMIRGYEEAAKNEHSGAHSELARQYCGRLCIYNFEKPENEADKEYVRRYGSSIIPVNYIKAYMHFLLVKDFKENQHAQLKKLAKHMTEDEIAHARQLAEEWKKNYYSED